MKVEVEADGLQKESLDSDEVRSVCFLSLQKRVRFWRSSARSETYRRVALPCTRAAFKDIEHLPTSDLDLTQLLQSILEFRSNQQGGERDVLESEPSQSPRIV